MVIDRCWYIYFIIIIVFLLFLVSVSWLVGWLVSWLVMTLLYDVMTLYWSKKFHPSPNHGTHAIGFVGLIVLFFLIQRFLLYSNENE